MATIRFDTTLCTIHSWTILLLPKSASEQLNSRGQVMVTGTINGFKFQTALEPDGRGSHWFRVDKNLQKSAGIAAGDTVTVELEATKQWPEPDIPADWQAALDADTKVRERWQSVTPMARWEWLRWIGSTKQAATRKHHIEVACSKLLRGERRPCCFNRAACCVQEVSKGGQLLEPSATKK